MQHNEWIEEISRSNFHHNSISQKSAIGKFAISENTLKTSLTLLPHFNLRERIWKLKMQTLVPDMEQNYS